MTPAISLTGGDVLAADGMVTRGDVHVSGAVISAKPAPNAKPLDCTGLTVLPGLVDVHGDSHELALAPRAGVTIDVDTAMTFVDRQLLACGITTAFHGVSMSWEPGVRSVAAARRFMEAFTSIRGTLLADHRVQLRWEMFAHDAIPDILDWLAATPTPSLAFNDHLTETQEVIAAGDMAKLDVWARRAGVSLDTYIAAVRVAEANAAQVRDRVAEVAGAGRDTGAVMLGHDEATDVDRTRNRALGMTVSEFPMSIPAAAEAVARGEHVVLGAPNVMRGKSHKGVISAAEAVAKGVCTCLASDYHYPSMMRAAETLTRAGASLADAWALISANPAAAMGLTDRGLLTVGHRADIVVVDMTDRWQVRHTISGGRVTSFGA